MRSFLFLSYSLKKLDFSILTIQVIIRFLRQGWTMDKNERKIDIDGVIKRLKNSEDLFGNRFPLEEHEVQTLCFLARSLLIGQPMLLQLDPPVIVCGDIHGQFKDLLHIFATVGEPDTRSYLFLGDYVDRGKKSLECFCLLMAYKVKYPLNFFMLRGNHQCCELNKIYGFYDECKRKFGIKLWKTVSSTFEYLPVAAVVGSRVFCVHGGISPQLKKLELLNKIKRPVTNNENKLVCDLLWSDPTVKVDSWDVNFQRGISCVFGKKALDAFIGDHGFDFVCRSHQVVQEGYEFFNERKLLTIFSAPNYCGEFQNLGGILKISKDMVCSITQFQGSSKKITYIKRSLTPMSKVGQVEEEEEKEKNAQNLLVQKKAHKERRVTKATSLNLPEDLLKENAKSHQTM